MPSAALEGSNFFQKKEAEYKKNIWTAVLEPEKQPLGRKREWINIIWLTKPSLEYSFQRIHKKSARVVFCSNETLQALICLRENWNFLNQEDL